MPLLLHRVEERAEGSWSEEGAPKPAEEREQGFLKGFEEDTWSVVGMAGCGPRGVQDFRS